MQESERPIPEFIQKLLKMMEQQPSLLNWSHNGQQLVIYDQNGFENDLLKVFFRHGKIESFVRQLNMYGFHKVCRNKNSINFRNKYFFKGNQINYHLIKRRKKDAASQIQPTIHKPEKTFINIISQRYDKNFSELSTIVMNVLNFKSRNTMTMTKLRKTMQSLGRELNDRKMKAIKPAISQVKEVTSCVEDAARQIELTIEQFVTQSTQNAAEVKVEEPAAQELIKRPSDNPHAVRPQELSYPALHSGFFRNNIHAVFHPSGLLGSSIRSLTSLNSFNSVSKLSQEKYQSLQQNFSTN